MTRPSPDILLESDGSPDPNIQQSTDLVAPDDTDDLSGGAGERHLLRLALAAVVAEEYVAAAYLDHTDHAFVDQATPAPGYDDGKYMAAAKYWGSTIASMSSTEWHDLGDLDEARTLRGLAVAYDWLWPYLDEQERQDWAQAIALESAHFVETTAGVLATDPDHYSNDAPNEYRRELLNGHVVTHFSSIGIAAEVLRAEMCASGSLWYEMWWDAHSGILDAEAELGTDGANHNGVYYGLDYLGEMLKYDEAMYSRSSAADWDSDWYENAPQYVDYMTMPNQHRSWLEDGIPKDLDGPGWQLGLVANETGRSSDQYLAWLGQNAITYPSNLGRRDVFDVLFWDETLPTDKEANHDADTHPNHCFEDTELVSLRTGWDTGDTWLSFDGGPRDGGHGDPAAGTLEMYRGGYLLTADGEDNVKRTATQSVFLVGNPVTGGHVDFGQHGDGLVSTDPVPEDGSASGIEQNNADLLCFLDNSSDTAGVDFVTTGADLTQMYRSDAPPVDAPYGTDVDADPLESVRKLTALERYLVWSGGDVLVYDRYTASGSSATFDITSMFTTASINDNGARATCPALAESPYNGHIYYDYMHGTSTAYLRWHDDPVLGEYGNGRTYTYDGVATESDVPMQDYNAYTPSGCASGAVAPLSGSGSAWTVTSGSMSGGHLQVSVLDSWSSGNEADYTATGSGALIVGQQLRRAQSRSGGGFFLTGLRPYVGSTAPSAPVVTSYTTGAKVTVSNTDGGKYLLALFDDPTNGSAVSDGSGNSTNGYAGSFLFATSAMQKLSAASMVHGTALQSGSHAQVTVSGNNPASIGLTYQYDGSGNPTAIWGTVDIPDGLSSLTLTVYGNGGTPLTGVNFRGVGGSAPVGLSGTVASGAVTFTVPGDGQFQVDLTSSHVANYWNLTECSGP